MQFNNLEKLSDLVGFLDAFCNQLNDVVFLKDVEHVYLYVNAKFLEMHEFTYAETLGQSDTNIFGALAERFIRTDNKIIQTGIAYHGIELNEFHNHIYHNIVQKVPVFNKNNEIIGIFGISHDITEQMNFIKKINAEYRLLDTILQNAPFAIFLKDINGKYIMVNEKFANYHNKTPEEIQGLTDYDLFSPHSAEKYRQRDKQLLAVNAEKDVQITTAEINNRIIHSVSTKYVTQDKDGQSIGIVGISQDITDLQALESKLLNLQKMQSIQKLSAGIAHDLNNYLASIMGHASLLQVKITDESVQKSLSTIIEASKNSKKLIENLLSFSKEKHVDPLCFDLHKELTKIISLLRPTIPPYIKLTHRFSHIQLFADQILFNQGIMNLIINANESIIESGAKNGTIHVSSSIVTINSIATIQQSIISSPYCIPGKYIKIEIRDSGKGIATGDARKIFEPFYTTKSAGSGSGIGLSIVFNLIVSHKGFLELDSVKNKFTVFTLYFPFVDCVHSMSNAISSKSIIHAGLKVLIIEDDSSIRELLGTMLTILNHSYMAAINGIDGIKMFSIHKFDLVILDLMMPGMTGDSVYEKLVELNPNVPIIISSGYGKHKWHAKIQEIRPDHMTYLNKPYEIADLSTAIKRVLYS